MTTEISLKDVAVQIFNQLEMAKNTLRTLDLITSKDDKNKEEYKTHRKILVNKIDMLKDELKLFILGYAKEIDEAKFIKELFSEEKKDNGRRKKRKSKKKSKRISKKKI